MPQQPPPGQPQGQGQAAASAPTAPAPVFPSNEEVITNLLHSLNVQEGQYEPQVVALLAEYMRTTMRTQLEDALDITRYSNKRHVDLSDLRTATQLKDMEMEKSAAPSRDMMLEVAAEVNSVPLRPIPREFGVILPKPHEMLSSRNYQVITAKEAFLGQSANQDGSVGQLHATFRPSKPPAKRSRSKEMKLVLNSPAGSGGGGLPTPQATPTPPSTMPPPQFQPQVMGGGGMPQPPMG